MLPKLRIKDLWDHRFDLIILLISFLLFNATSSFILDLLSFTGFFKFTELFISNINNNILFILILSCSLGYALIYRFLFLGLKFTYFSLIQSGIIFTSYLILRGQTNPTGYLTFSEKILYSDLLAISISLMLLKFKPYRILSIKPNRNSFFEDQFDHNIDHDAFNRMEFAGSIANLISQTVTTNSFGIAIIGNWGAGKTTFLDFLKTQLKKHEENELIDFNPWNVSEPNQILKDLFETFGKQASKMDNSLNKMLLKYSNKLLEIGDGYKILPESLSSLLKSSPTLKEQYEAINIEIKNSGKRFIIFIDDFDRLTGKEIIQVFKIIRNTSDFANVFFIVGLDLNYVKKALNKTGEVANEDSFHQKIFQLELFLPPIKKAWLIDILVSYFSKNSFLNQHLVELKRIIDKLEASLNISNAIFGGPSVNLAQNFESKRDVIRFINSLNISMSSLSYYVIIEELFVLEIIKSKYPTIYWALADKTILDNGQIKLANNETISGFVINDKILDFSIEMSPFEKLKIETIRATLNYLFAGINHTNPRSIIFPSNHQIFFNYVTLNLISGNDETEFWKADLDEKLKIISEWKESNKMANFNSMIDSIQIPNNYIELVNYIELLLNLAPENQSWINKIISLISMEFDSRKLLEDNKQNFLSFVVKSIGNENIDSAATLFFGERILASFEKGNISYLDIRDAEEIRASILKRFKVTCEKATQLNYKLLRLFYSNIQSVEKPSDNIVLSQDAIKYFREVIEKFKEDFLIISLRPYQIPQDKQYVFDPFTNQLFKSEEKNWKYEYMEFIQSYNPIGDKVKLKNILLEKLQTILDNERIILILNQDEIDYLSIIQKDYL